MRGRKPGSVIRQNVVEILAHMKSAYAYQISKVYMRVYPKVEIRSIYYHLRKGLALREFSIDKVKTASSPDGTGQIFYTLGPDAKPKGDPKVKRNLEE